MFKSLNELIPIYEEANKSLLDEILEFGGLQTIEKKKFIRVEIAGGCALIKPLVFSSNLTRSDNKLHVLRTDPNSGKTPLG